MYALLEEKAASTTKSASHFANAAVHKNSSVFVWNFFRKGQDFAAFCTRFCTVTPGVSTPSQPRPDCAMADVANGAAEAAPAAAQQPRNERELIFWFLVFPLDVFRTVYVSHSAWVILTSSETNCTSDLK